MPLSAGQRVDAAAEGGRCARESCVWAMRDGCPSAVRAQWRRGSPSDVPMSRRFALQRNQPDPALAARAAFERSLAASVQCMRARRGTSAWRMRTQWPASASAAASWSARDLRSRCCCCSSALGSAPAPAWKVVNVRAIGAHGRCAIEDRSRCDRSGACGHPVRKRADPVCLIQPRRAARTLLAGHAGELVARLCVLYSVRIAR